MLSVGDLTFEVRRSARRRSLEILVGRGGNLVISAPPDVTNRTLAQFVREKRSWIFAKLAEKRVFRQPLGTKEFVTGEGFPFLGRSYRLLLVDDQDCPLKLEGGRFRLLRTETERGRQHFIAWYAEQGRLWLCTRTGEWAPRIGVVPSGIEVRELGFRWGSCSKGGTLRFHWATNLLPPSIVDYVIVHELVHLHEANHTPEFWRRVRRALPGYDERKRWLAENGGAHIVL